MTDRCYKLWHAGYQKREKEDEDEEEESGGRALREKEEVHKYVE